MSENKRIIRIADRFGLDIIYVFNIICGERIFFRDKYQADEYDLYILRRAGDLIPLERKRLLLIMKEKGQ